MEENPPPPPPPPPKEEPKPDDCVDPKLLVVLDPKDVEEPKPLNEGVEELVVEELGRPNENALGVEPKVVRALLGVDGAPNENPPVEGEENEFVPNEN